MATVFNTPSDAEPPKITVHVTEGTGAGAPEGDDQDFDLSSSTDGQNLGETGAHIPQGQEIARSNISTVLVAGSTIGAFTVERKLGQGAMGAVFLVSNPLMPTRKYALKVMAGKYVDDPLSQDRFIKEIKAVSQIESPYVVKAEHAEILPDGRAIFVAEFVPGGDLSKKIGQPLPVNEVMSYGKQIAIGVSAAHEKGIIHRDLKPANIFITAQGNVKVGDFGLAKLTADADRELGAHTAAGTILGTPRYISPEGTLGSSAVDERADVYSLGCILYELSTGRFPHFEDILDRDENIAALSLFNARVSGKLPTSVGTLRAQFDIRADELPPAFEELIMRMMSVSPSARPTMSEVVASLDALEHGRSYSYAQLLETVEQRQSAVGTLERVSTPRSRLRMAVLALLGLVTTGGGVGVGYAYLHSGDQKVADVSGNSLPSSKEFSLDQPPARSSDVLRNVSTDSGTSPDQPHSLHPEKPKPDTQLTIEDKDGIKIYRLRSGADHQGTAQCGSEWHHPNDLSKRTASTLFFSVDQYRAYLGLSDEAPLPLEKYGDGVDTFVYEFDDGTSLHSDPKSQTLIYYPKRGKPILYSNDPSVRDSLKATGRYSVSDEGVMGAPRNPDLFVAMKNWTMNPDEDPHRMVGNNNERQAYTGPMMGLMDWLRTEGGKIHKTSSTDLTSVK